MRVGIHSTSNVLLLLRNKNVCHDFFLSFLFSWKREPKKKAAFVSLCRRRRFHSAYTEHVFWRIFPHYIPFDLDTHSDRSGMDSLHFFYYYNFSLFTWYYYNGFCFFSKGGFRLCIFCSNFECDGEILFRFSRSISRHGV
jgi:hypothetical protein